MTRNHARIWLIAALIALATVMGSVFAAVPASADSAHRPSQEDPVDVQSIFGSTNIKGSWRMANNHSVHSPDGNTRLTLLRGLLEVWRNGDHVWTADQSLAGDHVDFQTDGNLVVYTSNGSPVWASNTTFNCLGNACHLAIENSGNVAVEDTSTI
jgi:hypothetical protein